MEFNKEVVTAGSNVEIITTYDRMADVRSEGYREGYDDGLTDGLKEGFGEGIEVGVDETTTEIATNLLKCGMTVEVVHENTKLPLEDVLRLKLDLITQKKI